MSKNLTLSLDPDLLRAARKVALDRDTSVNQLVRDYLAALIRESGERQAALGRLDDIFHTQSLDLGRKNWKRDDLHERR